MKSKKNFAYRLAKTIRVLSSVLYPLRLPFCVSDVDCFIC